MKTFLGFSLLAAASGDSTVNKVIQLLDELKGKVQADLEAEAAGMESYNKWCDTEKTETSYDIKDETRVIGEESAKIENAEGKIEENSAKISELVPAIAQLGEDKKSAEAKRAEEHKLFLAEEKELVEAEDMLRRAYGILKRATSKGESFIQGSKQMNEVVAALGAIVDAAWMSPSKVKKVQSFLESDDLSLAQAPQASTSNYDSKSGGILTTIDEMRDEVQEKLRGARTAETKSRHNFELFVQNTDNQTKTHQDALAQAKAALGSAKQKLGAAQKALKAEQEAKAADEKYLAETTKSCADKAAMWEERQASAAEEMQTLESAKEVLSQKVVVLAQTHAALKRVSADSNDRRQKVVSMLRKLGHRFNSFGLLQAASSAQADPFAKVRELIKEMIAKLEKQAKDEAGFKETCDKNIAEHKAKKAKKASALEKYEARLTGAQAKSTKNKNMIATLKQELKELAAAVKEATAMRNKENAANTKVIEENKASAAAVGEAITILRDFYGSTATEEGEEAEAFVQKGAAAPGVEFAAAKSDGTHGIIAILETAQADFTKLYQETEEEEASSLADYNKFIQAGEVTKAKKEALIMGKQAENKSLAVQISEVQQDLTNTQQEFDDVAKALSSWEDKCANKAMSYEERKSRREAELAGLQDALTVLSPNTAFLQRDE